MCGFCLSTAGRPSDQQIAAIEKILTPRGPDGRGELTHDGAWMLHRRLAIIDPGAASAQPFMSGKSAVAYNGEIYNFAELQNRLPNGPTTVGDTEVFSHILSTGSEIDQMRGMYAGVSVEGNTVRLTRDRFGIKPLYRAVDSNGKLHVASQVRCFKHLLPECTIDDDAIACFLRFGNVHGGGTIFNEVKEVPAGTTETWTDGELTSVEPLPPIEPGGDLRTALFESMERHLVADTDIAVLLSAGLDSATLAYLAKELGADPVCVTIAAVDGRDESLEAAATAKSLGLRHEIVEIDESNALACLDEFFDAMDQPSIDGLNTFFVSRAVRSLGLKVALSGLGADELFGGYSSFKRVWWTHRLRRVPRPLLGAMVRRTGGNPAKIDRWLDARHDPGQLATISREVSSPQEIVAIGHEHIDPSISPGSTNDPVLNSEVWRYMSPTLLRDADAFSMANSVELRVPFLDDQVADAAFARSKWARATRGKRAIVEALGSPLLREIFSRPKTGFELPVARWADERFASHEVLSTGSTRKGAIRRWPLLVLDAFRKQHSEAMHG